MAVDRLSALCEQTALTGIDFIQVVEPEVQTVLRVFFVVEPSALDVPMVNAALLIPPSGSDQTGPLLPDPALIVTIVSSETDEAIEIVSRGWRLVRAPAGVRLALEILVAEPGDFAIHVLHIEDARVDLFFNDRAFSFKQGCPSIFDCREPCDPEPIQSADYPVDYLARDFWSLRRALLDMAAARYPRWSEPLEADQAVMLIEIMAALGDELAFAQDRIARELTLESATQRRSRSGLARLVDYMPDPGGAAQTELAVFVATGGGGATAAESARVWALPESRPPIPFSVEEGAWHHEAWNRIPLHQPDGDVACLPTGTTAAYLVTQAPVVGQLPPAATQTPEAFWIGRRAILRRPGRSRLAVPRPSGDHHRGRTRGGSARAHQRRADQHHSHRLGGAHAVPAPARRDRGAPQHRRGDRRRAGDRDLPRRLGRSGPRPQPGPFGGRPAVRPRRSRAVERESPLKTGRTGRDRIVRYGLRAAETRGLGWKGRRDPLGIGAGNGRRPMLGLREVRPPLMTQDPNAPAWTFHRDLLTADLDTAAYTLEEGIWRSVVVHQTPSESVIFQDYAGDDGWTVRFGDGDFGRPPEDGAVIEAIYFTAAQADANVPPDSVTHLEPPPGAPPGAVLGYASGATNPLAITNGVSEESPADVRINAPEAWRAWPLRAVRPEDYSSIIERLDFVQRANAITAWTGSWSTDFAAADPRRGVGYSPAQRDELGHVVDCIRLAVRDARVADPDYLDIDLDIAVCVSAARIRARWCRASSASCSRRDSSIPTTSPSAKPCAARPSKPLSRRHRACGRGRDPAACSPARAVDGVRRPGAPCRAEPDHPPAERPRLPVARLAAGHRPRSRAMSLFEDRSCGCGPRAASRASRHPGRSGRARRPPGVGLPGVPGGDALGDPTAEGAGRVAGAGEGDLGVMLLEAWAYVLDVTGFYDARIAERAYIQTAPAAEDANALAALLGHRLRGAMAARVRVALEADGADPVLLRTGTAFRSEGFAGQPPQVFELDSDVTIWPQRNRWRLAPVRSNTFDGTLRFLPRRAPAAGAVVLVAGGDTGVAARVASIESETGQDGASYQRATLEHGASLAALTGSAVSSLTVMMLRLPLGPNAFATSAYTTKGATAELVLDAVYPQVRVGDWAAVELAGTLHAVRIDGVSVATVTIDSGSGAKQAATTVTFAPGVTRSNGQSLIFHASPLSLGAPTRTAQATIGPADIQGGAGLVPPVSPLGDAPDGGDVLLVGKRAEGTLVGATIVELGEGAARMDPVQGADGFAPELVIPVDALGNVAEAIRGETVIDEALGSADAAVPFNRFTLRKKPLVWREDASQPGRRPDLTVRVGGLIWIRADTFFGRSPTEEIYVVRQEADGSATVTFGDGARGARPPTGVNNIRADYRFGAGAAKPPPGTIDQIVQRVKGLAGVRGPCRPPAAPTWRPPTTCARRHRLARSRSAEPCRWPTSRPWRETTAASSTSRPAGSGTSAASGRPPSCGSSPRAASTRPVSPAGWPGRACPT